jgi:2-(3-amino-3-carboxypropyl)histidine synthase
MVLDFEKEKLLKELKRIKPRRILVQLPEGIKQNAEEILDEIEKLGIEIIFSGETCWGGCALALDEAKMVGADLIVHFGHAEFMKSDFPVLYVEMKDILNLSPLLKKSLSALKKFRTLGLSYSIQHRHDLEKVKKFYEDSGKKVVISRKAGRAAYEGHVVGCEYRGLKEIQQDVDCFVVIGNNFHSLGAALAVRKPVFLIDVYNHEIKNMEKIKDKIIKQRAISIEKFRKEKNIGIIMEMKPGQKFGSPKILLEKLKKSGKKPFVLIMNEITPDKIMNFYRIKAFVELGCPRVAVDDFAKYPRPILTYREALVALGEKSWENLLEEGIV